MSEFRLALAAEHDLEEIEAYIAQGNAAAAAGVVNNIEDACGVSVRQDGRQALHNANLQEYAPVRYWRIMSCARGYFDVTISTRNLVDRTVQRL